MAELKILNRRRGYQKAQITNLEKYLQDARHEVLSLVILHSKLERTERIRLVIDELRLEYYKIVDDAELSECEEELIGMEGRIEELQITIRELLEKRDIKEERQSAVLLPRTRVKLPEIPLPTFSGRYDEWNVFFDQFNALIANNEELSELQRLHYLKASLVDEAKQVIAVEDSYESLMQTLKKRYCNTRLIPDSHVNAILDVKRMFYESSKDLQQLLDQVLQHLRALKQMGLQMNELSEVIVINILMSKLDNETRRQLEMSLQSTELMSWNDFIEFLQKRQRALEGLERNTGKTKTTRIEKPTRTFVSHFSHDSKSPLRSKNCSYCKSQSHSIYNCEGFKNATIIKKYECLRQKKLCFNCLKANHTVSACNSKRCNLCDKKHHTLLHQNQETVVNNDNSFQKPTMLNERPLEMPSSLATVNSGSYVKSDKYVLLSTAIVYLKDSQGMLRPCRALLDSASQSNFITEDCAMALNIRRARVNMPVSGLNGAIVNVKASISTTVASSSEKYNKNVIFLIVPKITGLMPFKPINVSEIKIPNSIKLADPHFDKPNKVDLLLGAEVFFELLKSGKMKINDTSLMLQECVFGWLISGSVDIPSNISGGGYCHLSSNLEALDASLRKFWELEDVSERLVIKSEEQSLCEKHFIETHKRNSEGRYIVQIPLRKDIQLGDTRKLAEMRVQGLWRRLERNEKLKKLYCEFIREYEILGHMEKVVEEEDKSEIKSYLPHHGVYREHSCTTKLRVVFNASAVSTSGYSLNNLLLNGGVLQDDLFSIILRFRLHKFIFTADIVKMYRQILVDKDQCDLQRILWKESFHSKIQEYRLLTVTYGTKSAPYLATRVVKQLALDEEQSLPLASKVLQRDVYMDDILTGADNYQEISELKNQLLEICKRGGMTLHKWCTNSKDLITELQDKDEYLFKNEECGTVKTLGLTWNATNDWFRFTANNIHKDSQSVF